MSDFNHAAKTAQCTPQQYAQSYINWYKRVHQQETENSNAISNTLKNLKALGKWSEEDLSNVGL